MPSYMKACLCYYSGTGNTKLACQYIAGKAPAVEFSLYDMIKDKGLDLGVYDLVGFAAFADYLGPSKFFVDFVRGLPRQSGKSAFVFNTFGAFNGATLRVMASTVAKQGFTVVAGHALHMPENIPTMIMAGNANEQAPDEAELSAFEKFIAELNELAADRSSRGNLRFKLSLKERLIPAAPRIIGRIAMGSKMVDAALCTRCGLCVTVCPYCAVTLPDLPAFDQKKCYGCWACYNRCPAKAIYTKKYRGIGHYPEPIEAVSKKLKL